MGEAHYKLVFNFEKYEMKLRIYIVSKIKIENSKDKNQWWNFFYYQNVLKCEKNVKNNYSFSMCPNKMT